VLEEQYLESTNYEAQRNYAKSGESEKAVILRAFFQKQTNGSRAAKRWMELLRDRL
jgi:hypothetical protein